MQRTVNYKHLHYFWAVARAGGLSAAAARLHLTPQTLSGQIKQLEHAMGTALFQIEGKRLELTEAGRLAYSYADEMFSLAAEMGVALGNVKAGRRAVLKIGVADLVPKSLAQRLIAPALGAGGSRLQCREGRLDAMLADLALHRLDFVLSVRPVPSGLSVRSFTHRLGQSAIGMFAPRAMKLRRGAFPGCLKGCPLLLPGAESPLHSDLLQWYEDIRVVPDVVAEFDDSALMKAFGRAGAGVFPAPMAVRAEVEVSCDAVLLGPAGDIHETYYALSNQRRVTHPGLVSVLEGASALLEAPG